MQWNADIWDDTDGHWIKNQQTESHNKGLHTMTKWDLFQECKVGLTSENQLIVINTILINWSSLPFN